MHLNEIAPTRLPGCVPFRREPGFDLIDDATVGPRASNP